LTFVGHPASLMCAVGFKLQARTARRTKAITQSPHFMPVKRILRKPSARKTESHPFKIFRLPPKGYDLNKASPRELLLQGIPKRPDALTHPKLRSLWEQIAERRPRFVEPVFAPVEGFRPSKIHNIHSLLDDAPLTFRPHLDSWIKRLIESGELTSGLLVPQTTTNWCGAYVNRPAPEILQTVTGQWTVPSAGLPASAWNGSSFTDGQYMCGVWVGLDGTQGTNDVLQAGTLSLTTVSKGVVTGTQYSAWTEWFGAPYYVQSLAVSPGDLVSCTVCSPFQNNHGTAMFTNLSTNETANYGIDAPANTTLSGNVAEWITEDPIQANGALYPFPNFGQVIFTHCVAGSKTIELDIHDSQLVDLVDSSNSVRAQAHYQDPSSVRCTFLK
jgi:hypothetical protein